MSWWDRLWQWEDTHRHGVDVTLAVLLTLALVPVSIAAVGTRASGAGAVLVSLCVLGVVAPVAWRRTRPAAAVTVVYTCALLHVVAGFPVLPVDVVVPFALYSVALHGPRWAHRTGIVAAMVGSFVVAAALVMPYGRAVAVMVVVLIASIFLVAWAFGLVRRSRREHLEALVDRAQRLEVERDQQAIIATAAERSRIAREMHDIVAHSLSVIIAQADGGRYAAAQDPQAATRSLGTIAETGRAALTDMRRLLGVLREAPTPGGPGRAGADGAGAPGRAGNAGTAPGVATTTPQPAVEDIEQLVAQVRASGMRVSFVRLGTPRHLPPGAGLTVYRIAQESLTNVLKHAGPDPGVTLMLQWQPTSVTLEVSDDGRGAAADTDGLGQGLVGMHERATMFGGTVTAGPRPGGGFRVRATLPTPGSSTAPAPGAVETATPTPAPTHDPAGGRLP
ncbi:sensor histidine kinase [Cellulomonas dongxiuzhuiae]|uniref:histidine kinase n=1 Tax=Cellulomonas dongxiuzhuiae TaxID=2819979 RepID=A0ABX8GGT4_9CELL|nr:sensor histidine kinase [Cellulomonas dongxiuzhuiae]MBO3086683.1 sensor histidine kinase [Cellulomonas dongxiuzhuiae]MBO3093964.1 sensor histidine kinase [Cellulomonas dongxiuzhuiae]QWC15043.1 sensor histidine kinase [Cellulomonas dongxiuzhuiae]